jgi:hypothetical protein
MIITKRRAVSVEEVTKKLNSLAARYRLSRHCYDESASEEMSEFDAIKWVSLCSQRLVLQKRENEIPCRTWEVSRQIIGIYGASRPSSSVLLENTNEGLVRLAA